MQKSFLCTFCQFFQFVCFDNIHLDIENFQIVMHVQMAARYAANKQINLKKAEAAFREMIERLDCPEEGRLQSS